MIKTRSGDQGRKQHRRLSRNISCPWKFATISANLVLSLVAPVSLIFIWIHYLFFPLSEDFQCIMSNDVVILSYEVLSQAFRPALWEGSPRVLWLSGAGLWYVGSCFLQGSKHHFSPRPVTERWLQIVPRNSINFFTFWCFSLSSWDTIQLAGCECALCRLKHFFQVGGGYCCLPGHHLVTELFIYLFLFFGVCD